MDAGDALLALALVAGSIRSALSELQWPAVAFAVVLAAGLPISIRRRWPLPALAIVTAANCASVGLGASHSMVAGPLCQAIAIYSVARHERLRRALIGAGSALAALTTVLLVAIVAGGVPSSVLTAFVPAALLTGVIATLAGVSLRLRQAYVMELEARAAALRREREADVERAALKERARISRELHDIVAHELSVIVLQAGAAQALLGGENHPAAAPLAAIERTSREALVEMRRMLGVLRAGDSPGAPFAPADGLDRLDSLVAQVRAAGLPVAITVQGERRPLPTDLDLSAYRIVQDALTNCLRYAGQSEAGVRVTYGRDELELEIADNGRGEAALQGTGGGQGLIGIRERTTLLGGEFKAGPSAGGGFTVHVRLPLPAVP